MSLRSYVLFMAGATLLAWGAWGIILTGVDPLEAGFPGIMMFYITLSMALVGSVSLLLSFIRIRVLKHRDVPSREIRIAFRHALLFVMVLVTSLALSASAALHTWHLIALVAFVVLIEQLFVHTSRGSH